MKTRKQVIIPAVICLAVFGGLLTAATFTDLQVSQLLTKNALTDGTYNTNEWFGALFEIIGSVPTTGMLAISMHIFFLYGKRHLKGVKQTLMMLIPLVLAVVAYYVMVSDIHKYIKSILLMYDYSFNAAGGTYIKFVFAACALVLTVLGTLAMNNLKDETIGKLIKFAIAAVIATAIPTILVNLVFKSPIGRIRYRAMYVVESNPELAAQYADKYGFSAFAKWYEWNGQWISKPLMYHIWGNTDVLKSCPSGHTASAGATYCLIMINSIFDIKKKWVRAFNWIAPVVWTGLVAVARIVVGAHFFSDVLLGGSLAFFTVIVVREIVILKGGNLKVLFGKKNKV